MRKSANDEVTKKKDDVFDKYLEEPDWSEQIVLATPDNAHTCPDIAPRYAQDGNVESYLNLAATQEDHGGGEVSSGP